MKIESLKDTENDFAYVLIIHTLVPDTNMNINNSCKPQYHTIVANKVIFMDYDTFTYICHILIGYLMEQLETLLQQINTLKCMSTFMLLILIHDTIFYLHCTMNIVDF